MICSFGAIDVFESLWKINSQVLLGTQRNYSGLKTRDIER